MGSTKKYKKPLIIVSGVVLSALLFSNTSKKKSIYNKSLNAVNKAFKKLDATQEKSLSSIIDAWLKYGDNDLNKLAYIIATAWHESRLKPIEEIRAKPGTSLYTIQNAYWFTGYYGRGFVQLTHKVNYKKMSDFLGVDLVSVPELALNPKYAAEILVYGMINGIFTGKKLSDYINPGSTNDFFNARRIVNGLDRAQLINTYTIDLIFNA